MNKGSVVNPAPPAEVAQKVDIHPEADTKISARLGKILKATDWFTDVHVRVDQGVVFIDGVASSDERKEWASHLAAQTEDVAAVVNNLTVKKIDPWDLAPALNEIKKIGASAIQFIPLIAIGLIILLLTVLLARWSTRGTSYLLGAKIKNGLLRQIAGRAIAIPIILLGLYLALRVSGLTRLAITVVGGTGLLGLVLGFAFRDIAENFLASVLISIQHPFAAGDLIEINNTVGYVQKVNARCTLLMTFEGNYIQIPNATVYKATIKNLTANPRTRFDFTVGIGYPDSITRAQDIAKKVLAAHPAVTKDPDPMVLVDSLGSATVVLKIYFWIDIAKYSEIKVRSALQRLTKESFEENGISMPDDAREVIFPNGIPVTIDNRVPNDRTDKNANDKNLAPQTRGPIEISSPDKTDDLASEAHEIKEQVQNSRSPEKGQDLLKS